MKKIFHIVESTATGTLSMLKVLANSQASSGCQVTVIYSERPETPPNLPALFHQDINLVKVQMTGVKNKIISVFKIRSLIANDIKSVVFMHSSFAGFIGRGALIWGNVKCFYIPHCISFMRKDVSKYKSALFVLFEWLASIKECDYVACSASEQQQIKKYIPFRKCHLIENAVNTEDWVNKACWQEKHKVVITVGQIRTQKNPAAFADICRLAKQKGFDYKFIWVGDGDDVKQKDNLIKAGVDVLGWKTPNEVKALLSTAPIYLSTALWEGLPVSPVEAMLSGCVAVLSDCAGNRDIIEHKQNGFSFQSVEEATEILFSLAENKQLGEQVSRRGNQHARKQYCLERYIDEMTLLMNKGV